MDQCEFCGSEVCDLCNKRVLRELYGNWQYYEFDEDGTESYQRWFACAECANLVKEQDWETLLYSARALTTNRLDEFRRRRKYQEIYG